MASDPAPVMGTIDDADALLPRSVLSGKLPYHVKRSSRRSVRRCGKTQVLGDYNRQSDAPDCGPLNVETDKVRKAKKRLKAKD